MEEKILNSISNKLYSIFGNEHKYYTERIEQGFDDKSFFIKILDNSFNGLLQGEFLDKYDIEILYFPSKTTTQNNECWRIANKLKNEIMELSLEDCVLESSSVNTKIIDNVLIVDVTYQYFRIEEDDTDIEEFEELNINIK